jgi:AcrR family transcriptional regulator
MSSSESATDKPLVKTEIKRAARRLFAEHGIADVTVRQIARAAGQRNLGVVGYYFGTKENLVKAVLVDGAMVIERIRNATLDDLESRQRPPTIREVVEAMIYPSIEHGADEPGGVGYFDRFMLDLSLNHPSLIAEGLQGKWNEGYQRCLQHLRDLMTDLEPSEKNRRFIFLGSYISSILALRETILSDTSRQHLTWQSPSTLNDIVTTAVAILTAPIERAEERPTSEA